MKSLSRVAPVLLSLAFLFTSAGVAAAATATTLTVNPASGVYGGTVTLSAKLTNSNTNAPISGKTIIFTLNGVPVGTATTQVGTGIATVNAPTLGLVGAGVHANYVKALYLGGGGFTGDNGSNTLTLSQKLLTITGITAQTRGYIPGNTLTIIDTTNAHRSGVVLLDQVNLDTSAAVGNFIDPNVGTAKEVDISGITLTGADKNNYTLGTPQATATADITPIPQNFSFVVPSADQTLGTPDFTVSATTDAGNTGTTVYDASGSCSATGNTIHLFTLGTCTVTASNPGDGNYNPAGPIPQSFNVALTPVSTTNVVVVTKSDLDTTSSNPATVRADGLNKWFMYNDTNDTIDNTLGSFVAGPATPPLGTGSIQFALGANTDRKNIATYQFAGTPLNTLTALSYSEYSHSGVGSPNEAPYLNFNIDFTGTSGTYQRRLVYVPASNGTITQDTWQNWDAISGGNAKWNYSGPTWPVTTVGPDANATGISGGTLRTWTQILADYPNARVLPTDSWVGVRVGEPGPTGYVGDVDDFTIATSSTATSYDFDPGTGNLVINKYACPAGTVVTRVDNGVGGTLPAGCNPEAGVHFGYVHGTQTDNQGPYPEIGQSFTLLTATDVGGVSTNSLPADGRYLVAETDSSGNQLAANVPLGLYCTGDGDTSGTNDNQELTFVPANGSVQCVSYDVAPLLAPDPISPPDQTLTNTANQQLITWSSVSDGSDPVTYFYQVSNDPTLAPDGSFANTPYAIIPTGTDSQISTPNTPDGTYYWHVYAQDNDGNKSPWSVTQEITVSNTLPTAAFTFPTPGPTATTFQVTFSEPVNQAEATDPANYFLNNWPGAGGSGPLTGNANVSYDAPSNTATVSFTNPGWYVSPEQQWGVQNVHDLYGNLLSPNPTTAYSSPLVAPTAPGTPTTATPTTSTSQDWTWGAATDPTDPTNASGVASYSYKVTDDNNANAIVTDWTNVGNTLGVTTNLPVGSYTMHVTATDNAGNTGPEATGQVVVNAPVIIIPPPPATYTVTIDKYINGVLATAASANNAAFPMQSSWNSTLLGGAGNGSYDLGTDDSYEAVTSPMNAGSSYTTNEVPDNVTVGNSCTDGAPYAFVGYSTGDSAADAAAATVSTTVPNFSDLESNEYVAVWNVGCPSVVTDAADTVTANDANLNATNGPADAQGHSFWISTTSGIDTSTTNIPSGVYSTPDMGAVTANTGFTAALSLATTQGVPSNMPQIQPNTTYYYVAWVNVGGTWYHGAEQHFTTGDGPIPATPSVTTGAPTAQSMTDATLNGTVGPVNADAESFWVSDSAIDTSSSNIPSGVYSTPVLPAVTAGNSFSDPLSLVTTAGIPSNHGAITAGTTYHYVAWAEINGTWYHGNDTTVTTLDAAPVLSNEHLTVNSDTSVVITWTTDHAATSRVVYGTSAQPDGATNTCLSTPGNASYECYGYSNSTDETDSVTKVTSHSVTVNGLTPGVTYYFRPVSQGSPEAAGSELMGVPADPVLPVISITPSPTDFTDMVGVAITPIVFTASDDAGDTFNMSETGDLPDGLATSTTGNTVTISGTPTTVGGPFSFDINAASSTDAGNFSSDAYTITITATPPPMPVAVADTATTNDTNEVTIDVLSNDSNATGVTGISSTDNGGTAVVDADGTSIDYTPSNAAQIAGTDSFTYEATGPGGTSAAASVTVTINDTTVPVVTVNGDNPDYIQTGITYSDQGATVTDTPTDSVDYTVTLDGVATTSDFTLDTSVDGTHTVVYSATDHGGNTGTATRTIVVDGTPPSATLTSTSGSPTTDNPIHVTATFSEPVTGFDQSDISATGGISNFAESSSTVYTFDLTPSSNDVQASIGIGKYQDLSGNSNTTEADFDVTYSPGTAPSGSSGGGGGGGGGGVISGNAAFGAVNTNPTGGGVVEGTSTEVVTGNEPLPAGCTALLTEYMGMGKKNNPAQVKLLQTFLNGNVGTNLPITGFFGSMTTAAVKQFQLKYANVILTPWGLTQPTGYVYKLTEYEINLNSCSTLNAPVPDISNG